MKNKIIASLAIISLSLTLACAKHKVEPRVAASGADLSELPAWVADPSIKDGIGALGIAAPSKGGIQFQIPRAELDGKGNLASTIQNEISRVTKSAMRSGGVNEQSDVDDFFSQATKEVVKSVPLSAARRDAIYVGKDGTLYVHMVLKNEDYSKYLANSEKMLQARLKKSDLSRDSIDKAQKATKEMFDELETERAK